MWECGEQLKTTHCKRLVWWPGGKCGSHGRKNYTLEDWMIGLHNADPEDYLPHLNLHCGENDYVVSWSISEWRGRNYVTYSFGKLSPEEIYVISDSLESKGITEITRYHSPENIIQKFHAKAAKCIRNRLFSTQDLTPSQRVSQTLRDLGVQACEGPDCVVLSLSEAELLIERLQSCNRGNKIRGMSDVIASAS